MTVVELSSHLIDRLRVNESDPPIVAAREGTALEFKKSFNWENCETYSKTMAAFANNRGGYIVFGVGDRPRILLGLAGNAFERRDDATITAYLNQCFAPEIEYERDVVTVRGVQVGFVYVFPAKRKPIICTRNGSESKEGDIFYRYRARSERIHYSELAAIISEIEENVQNRWLDLMREIGRVGVLDSSVIPSSSAKGATVVSPSDDPNAPLIRLSDSGFQEQFPLNHKRLLVALKERCPDFKANPRFYSILREVKKGPSMHFLRELDPGNPKSVRQTHYSRSAIDRIVREWQK